MTLLDLIHCIRFRQDLPIKSSGCEVAIPTTCIKVTSEQSLFQLSSNIIFFPVAAAFLVVTSQLASFLICM